MVESLKEIFYELHNLWEVIQSGRFIMSSIDLLSNIFEPRYIELRAEATFRGLESVPVRLEKLPATSGMESILDQAPTLLSYKNSE